MSTGSDVEDTEIIFVSGLSGSGKSTAMAALEDLSFYCVDNLPPQLVPQFLDLCRKSKPPIARVAIAVDAREQRFLQGFPTAVEEVRSAGASVRILFLECADDVLANRYRETRRVHPMSPSGSVDEGVARETARNLDVAHFAVAPIDTTALNVHQLKEAVIRNVEGGKKQTVVNVLSFGFRYGPPTSAELLFDVRFLPNPYFQEDLRSGTGLEDDVAAYALDNPVAEALLEHLERLLDFLLPLYDREGKAYVTIGVGCTGGRHRSVAVVRKLDELLRARGREVNLDHRDVEREL
ncbi:MAG: RNase adapter RapZ [Myxococcota bacterium]|nr:RNase adapter RapZ [Myxococcota bacterium]